MLKTLIVKAAFIAFVGSVSFAAHAIADTQRFDIPAGDLIAALESFAKQADVDVVYQDEQVKGLRTGGVSGIFSPHDAVMKLLEGTSLQLRTDEASGALLITTPLPSGGPAPSTSAMDENHPKAAARADTAAVREKRSFWNRFRLVDDEDIEEIIVTMPEVLVRGSRTLNMDIRRTRDDPQPYVIFDRATIESSGATNLEDFLKNRLPMNTIAAPTSQSPGSTINGGQTQINLRGLGTSQTLILIDGRRTADYYNGNPNQGSINGVPLSAIERIEVLPTTASGIYGGSATGGVVNIILRRDYSGVEFKLNYGNTFQSDARTRQLDLSGGFNLEEGRTRLLFAATYSDAEDLENGQRDFVERGRAIILANNPGFFLGANPPAGATTNIRSATGSNLTLKDGTPLNSPITFVPAGYVGPNSDGGAALVANAGQYNLGPPDSAITHGNQISLLSKPRNESVIATARREFTPRVEMFVEGAASNVMADSIFSAGGNTAIISASAPNNPFAQAIRVNVPFNTADAEGKSRTETRRLAGGILARLPRDWLAGSDYTWSRTSRSYTTPPSLSDSVPGTLSWTTAVSNGTVNVLRDTSAFPLDPTEYLQGRPPRQFAVEPFVSTLQDATLRAAGPLGTLPAGAPVLSVLVEHRDVDFAQGAANALGTTTIFPQRSQSIDSVYLEARVPVVSARNGIRGIRELEVQLAGRWDEYVTYGANFFTSTSTVPPVRTRNEATSVDPTVALWYEPLSGLALRMSYGTGFLPPSVHQLSPGAPQAPSTSGSILDPRRGNRPLNEVPFTTISGGNPDLQSEESESWSAGVVLAPAVVPGLRVSVDWAWIAKTDNITTLNVFQLFDNEALVPGFLVRGPNLPGDPAGWPGPVTAIQLLPVNISRAKVEAYDIQIDYEKNTEALGTFGLHALATRQTHYETQLVPTAPLLENVGITSSNPLKLRGNIGLSWTHRQWLMGWNATYFDSYLVADARSSTSATTFVNQGSDRVPSQTYHDAFVRYRFAAHANGRPQRLNALAGTEIQLGINNVFNTKPPFDASDAVANLPYYSPFGDPRLANYYLSIRHAF